MFERFVKFVRFEMLQTPNHKHQNKKAALLRQLFYKLLNLNYSSILILPFDLAITSSATFVGAGA
jgi:hypothetical protein